MVMSSRSPPPVPKRPPVTKKPEKKPPPQPAKKTEYTRPKAKIQSDSGSDSSSSGGHRKAKSDQPRIIQV